MNNQQLRFVSGMVIVLKDTYKIKFPENMYILKGHEKDVRLVSFEMDKDYNLNEYWEDMYNIKLELEYSDRSDISNGKKVTYKSAYQVLNDMFKRGIFNNRDNKMGLTGYVWEYLYNYEKFQLSTIYSHEGKLMYDVIKLNIEKYFNANDILNKHNFKHGQYSMLPEDPEKCSGIFEI